MPRFLQDDINDLVGGSGDAGTTTTPYDSGTGATISAQPVSRTVGNGGASPGDIGWGHQPDTFPDGTVFNNDGTTTSPSSPYPAPKLVARGNGQPEQTIARTGGSSGGTDPNMQRILSALAAVKSTDDPNYWYQKISSDPNGFGSAWNYWADRINRGDGSSLVANGTLQKFNDGPQPPGGSNFADPNSAYLEALAKYRAGMLTSPITSPYLDNLLKQLTDQQAVTKQRAADLATTLKGRAADLNQYPYTAGDEAVMKTKAVDSLERRRQQTLKNARESVYARGFAPTSGLAQDAENQVNTSYDQQRGGIESTLLNNAISESQRRKDEATQLEMLASQALQGGDVSAIQNQASAADLETQLRNEMDKRSLEAMQSAAVPIDLADKNAQTALGILGGTQGTNPLTALLPLLTIASQSAGVTNSNTGNILGGLGALIPLILPFL
jgi:hypothetical protein